MDLVIRAAVMYALILMLTRVLGRRELSQLQPFDLILLVVIGDLIQQGVMQNDLSITGVFIVLSTIGVLQGSVSYAVVRFRRLWPLFNGEPGATLPEGKAIASN